MLSTSRIDILIDVIIVDLVQTNLILQDDYDNGDLSKRRILSQSIFDGCIFFIVIKVFDCLHQYSNKFFIHVLTWCD